MFFASFHQRNRNLAFVDFDTSVLSNIPNKVFASVRGLLLHYMYASEDIHLSCLKADLREVTEISLFLFVSILRSCILRYRFEGALALHYAVRVPISRHEHLHHTISTSFGILCHRFYCSFECGSCPGPLGHALQGRTFQTRVHAISEQRDCCQPLPTALSIDKKTSGSRRSDLDSPTIFTHQVPRFQHNGKGLARTFNTPPGATVPPNPLSLPVGYNWGTCSIGVDKHDPDAPDKILTARNIWDLMETLVSKCVKPHGYGGILVWGSFEVVITNPGHLSSVPQTPGPSLANTIWCRAQGKMGLLAPLPLAPLPAAANPPPVVANDRTQIQLRLGHTVPPTVGNVDTVIPAYRTRLRFQTGETLPSTTGSRGPALAGVRNGPPRAGQAPPPQAPPPTARTQLHPRQVRETDRRNGPARAKSRHPQQEEETDQDRTTVPL